MNRNITTATIPPYTKYMHLRPFGFFKDGIFEINLTGVNLSGTLVIGSIPFIPPHFYRFFQADFLRRYPYSEINSTSFNFWSQFQKNADAIPMIITNNHWEVNYSYRYINPMGIDKNLYYLSYVTIIFLIAYCMTSYFYRRCIKNILLIYAADIKIISFLIMTLLIRIPWLLNNYCRYLEHFYPIGNTLCLYLSIQAFNPRSARKYKYSFFCLCFSCSYIFYISLTDFNEFTYRYGQILLLILHFCLYLFVQNEHNFLSMILLIEAFYLSMQLVNFIASPPNNFFMRVLFYEIMHLFIPYAAYYQREQLQELNRFNQHINIFLFFRRH